MFQTDGNFSYSFFEHSRRGMTLVELMIVIAIIGILAAIGLVSFTEYIEEGRMTELRQYCMDLERGQEQYFSRHHHYLDIEDVSGTREYDDTNEAWTQLLEFNPDLPDNVSVFAEGSGEGGNNCGATCPGSTDPGADNEIWFAVCATNTDASYDIYYDSTMDQPMEVESSDCSF